MPRFRRPGLPILPLCAHQRTGLSPPRRIRVKEGRQDAQGLLRKDPTPMSTAAKRLRIRSTSYVVIPARLASTRLPRKLLLSETGKTLLQHTYEAARAASKPSGLCVAADHQEIASAVRAFGGEVAMTS